MNLFEMGEMGQRKFNYKPEKDDPISVIKKISLPESQEPIQAKSHNFSG